jgi:FeS assembly SUF system protein
MTEETEKTSTDSADDAQKVPLPVLSNAAEVETAPPPPAVADQTAAPAASDQPPRKKVIEGKVIAALQNVYDPEIPVNIYELGLIYGIEVDDANAVKVTMTLTSPACPVAGSLPGEVERRVEAIPEVSSAEVILTWDPQWSKDMMSEVAMLQLGMF